LVLSDEAVFWLHDLRAAVLASGGKIRRHELLLAETSGGPAVKTTIAFFTIVIGGVALARPALANCAMPTGYQASVDSNNTVKVCAQNFQQRGCPDADGMLRKDVQGGSVVKLADFCDGDGGPSSCYLDECVPKGTYQYGFAKPYDCCGSCCGTDYYETVSVTTDPPSACALSPGDTGAQPFSGAVPWGTSQSICNYQPGTGGAPNTGGSAGVAGSVAAGGSAGTAAGGTTGTGGSATKSSSGSSDSGGCSLRPLGGASGIVIAFDGLLGLVGLTLLARRRRSKS
jgi:hypothetical protein